MPAHRLLLASTALSGLVAVPSSLEAAEVAPGGALDVTLSGFARFLATGGDWDATQLDPDLSRELDFQNDTEVHVIARAKDEQTGLEYGGTIEFEADTNRTDNADETWIFVRGGFGEVRLGDQDGAAAFSGMAVSAATIAAGTGGLDGTQVDTYVTKAYEPLGTSDATKIFYYTPTMAGFQLGGSYTPQLDGIDSGANNGDALATTDVEAQNVVEGAIVFEDELGEVGTTLGVSGLLGEIKDEATFGGDDWWALQGGAVLELFGFSLAGSYLIEEEGDFAQQAVTAGIAYEFGPLAVSLNYAYTLETDTYDFDNPSNLILSATYALAPGLTLDGDLAVIDNDLTGELAGEFNDDNGVAGVVQLGLAF